VELPEKLKPATISLFKRAGAKGEATLHSRRLDGALPLHHEDIYHHHHTRGEVTWILGGLGIMVIINRCIFIIDTSPRYL
jgi:hypothetical protein